MSYTLIEFTATATPLWDTTTSLLHCHSRRLAVAMADAGDDNMALVPARPDSSAVETARMRARRQKWDVEYARYFCKPRRHPSAPPPPGLRHITRGVHRHQGTWLPASSPAALCVSRPALPSAPAVPVLTVSIGDVVFVRTETPPSICSFFILITSCVCFVCDW